MEPLRVGIVGCGNISRQYFKGCEAFPELEVVAVADLQRAAAEKAAQEHSIARVLEVDALIDDPDVECVLNLTIPQAHAEINTRALNAGKHAYCEKPFALSVDEAAPVLKLAAEKGLYVGCAPDTFLSGTLQTARKAFDDGLIGRPLTATANMQCGGHETWHPSPEFYYKSGGGPLLDMGPYYLTTLVNLLGPVRSVGAYARASFAERTITSKPKHGQTIAVETPTLILATLDFANDTLANITFSFDHRQGLDLPLLQIAGTEGSLTLPDPNGFGGEVVLKRPGEEPESLPIEHPHGGQRSIGLADMARAIRLKRPHRVSGTLAHHVLEIMTASLDSGQAQAFRTLTTTCERPALLPVGLEPAQLTD
ncbi:MAG: Gfo/Idh/MocA family protein [Opitutales bacterium]